MKFFLFQPPFCDQLKCFISIFVGPISSFLKSITFVHLWVFVFVPVINRPSNSSNCSGFFFFFCWMKYLSFQQSFYQQINTYRIITVTQTREDRNEKSHFSCTPFITLFENDWFSQMHHQLHLFDHKWDLPSFQSQLIDPAASVWGARVLPWLMMRVSCISPFSTSYQFDPCWSPMLFTQQQRQKHWEAALGLQLAFQALSKCSLCAAHWPNPDESPFIIKHSLTA